MRSFFKVFFASLLALLVFSVIGFLFVSAIVGGLMQKDVPSIANKSVLVLDLSNGFKEQPQENPLSALSSTQEADIPGLYEVIQMIQHAANDKQIAALYIKANTNQNAFASGEELRAAIETFKKSGKKVIAYGDVIGETSYAVANAANFIYLNPAGNLEWNGLGVDLMFLKGTLDRLKIHPQIFYAGKFKSATEPFRETEMTEANRLQTREWLGDLYAHLLSTSASSRNIDSSTLHEWANTAKITSAKDAKDAKLVDDLQYEDQVFAHIRQEIGLDDNETIDFLSMATYAETGSFRKAGSSKIAVLYAQGDIVDGQGTDDQIGGERFTEQIRKLKDDNSIKAVVLRINSGGGSALASEKMWRELTLLKKEKPLVVSMGDVAASGGYYIASPADSIFADKTTITGSIGVFSLLPDMHEFFSEKLGITFDEVSTGPYANMYSVTRELSPAEKQLLQNSVDSIYSLFKRRVAEGRGLTLEHVDSIGQGRVWSGADAKRIGLIDQYGGLDAAVAAAASMANIDSYRLREYPQQRSFLDKILGRGAGIASTKISKELGPEANAVLREWQYVKQMAQTPQARLSYQFFIR